MQVLPWGLCRLVRYCLMRWFVWCILDYLAGLSHQISSFNGPQMLCLTNSCGLTAWSVKKTRNISKLQGVDWFYDTSSVAGLLYVLCLWLKHRSHTHTVYYARCLHRAWIGLRNLLTWPFGCKMLTKFALKINYPAKILHGWSMFRTTHYCKW